MKTRVSASINNAQFVIRLALGKRANSRLIPNPRSTSGDANTRNRHTQPTSEVPWLTAGIAMSPTDAGAVTLTAINTFA